MKFIVLVFRSKINIFEESCFAFPTPEFHQWKPKRVREQQLGFPDFASFGCFYLAFTCNFGQPISMIVLEYHDASFLWNKLKSSSWNSIKPTPHHAVPFRFQTLSFLPCSVLLSEARLWKKASILASLIQGVGQRSTEVSRKDFSSLIKLISKQFNHVWINQFYHQLHQTLSHVPFEAFDQPAYQRSTKSNRKDIWASIVSQACTTHSALRWLSV